MSESFWTIQVGPDPNPHWTKDPLMFLQIGLKCLDESMIHMIQEEAEEIQLAKTLIWPGTKYSNIFEALVCDYKLCITLSKADISSSIVGKFDPPQHL